MNAEIICIGTELLLGHVVNSNQAYLAQQLAEIGANVYYHSTVGDNPGRLAALLRTALNRSDVIITTGGLGPTVDDITVQVMADTFKRKRMLNKKVLQKIKACFKKRQLVMPQENILQAYIPRGAQIITNPYGTAPGLIIKEKGTYIVCLPGVPFEMQAMCPSMIRFLKHHYKKSACIVTKTINITGVSESFVNSKIKDILSLSGNTTAGIYCSPAKVEIKITAQAPTVKAAHVLINPVTKVLYERLGTVIYSEDAVSLEQVIGALLMKHKKTLAVAESCTGGLIADRVTGITGSSDYFLSGMITYSNQSKRDFLGVQKKTLTQYGAVSPQVASEMAEGMRRVAHTDYAVSTTGICGPGGGTRKKPVGLVFIACSTPDHTVVEKHMCTGGRLQIKYKAAQAALDMLRKQLIQRDCCNSPA